MNFIDLEAQLSKLSKDGLFEPDGVHLSPRGHDVLADLWLGEVIGM